MLDLVATILDNECEPQNPYIINLHCKKIVIHWKRLQHGFWNKDETIWAPGKYSYVFDVENQ